MKTAVLNNKRSLLMLTILAFAPALALAGETIDETIDVSENEIIDIEIINGDVTITGWNRSEVSFKGELSDRAESYDFSSRNGVTRFAEEYEDRRTFFDRNCSNWFDCSDDDHTVLEISVPRNATVRFEGINVELTLSDIAGNTQVDVVNGPIEATNLEGRINIEAVNGSIEASNLSGRINLSTVNGQIRDQGSRGESVSYDNVNGSIIYDTRAERVNAETVSGSIELDLDKVDNLETSAVSARVTVSLELLDGGRVEMSNVSGRTELLVNRNISASFDINTAVGGNIDNDLSDDRPVQENRFINSSELQFSLNGGSGNVEISSVSGDIIIGEK